MACVIPAPARLDHSAFCRPRARFGQSLIWYLCANYIYCTDLRAVCLDSRAHSPPSQVVCGVGVGVKIAGICTPGQAARKHVHKSTEEHSMAKDERNGNEEQVVSQRAQEYVNLSNRYQIRVREIN